MMNKKSLVGFILIVILVESILPTFTHSSSIFNQSGYGVIWLACLYIIGASFKILPILDKVRLKYAFLGYIVCAFLTWISYFSIEFVTNMVLGQSRGMGFFITYTSPFLLLMAIFLFIGCVKLKFNKLWRCVICFLSPLSFSVYLIHTNPLVYDHIIAGRFKFLATEPWFLLVGGILGFGIGIYLLCSLIDYLRQRLFLLCRVDSLARKLEVLIVENWGAKILRRAAVWLDCENTEKGTDG